MIPRFLIVASACLCGLALVPAVASAYEEPYEMSGEYSLVWVDEALQLDAYITGEGTEEAVLPCSGCPPLSIDPLPRGLTIRFSPSCMSRGVAIHPEPTTTWMPGPRPNTVTGIVAFTFDGLIPVYAEDTPFGRFCLIQNKTTSQPNPECAEYFAPEFCAKEFGSSKYVLGAGYMKFISTPTSRCRHAKAAARRALKRIRVLAKSLRRIPGRQPSEERRLEEMRHSYPYEFGERVVGECR